MLILPIESKDHLSDALVIVLGKDNVERMREADPFQMDVRQTGHRLRSPRVMVCYEEDWPALMQVVNAGDLKKTLAYLTRGFRFRPEKGDHDRGPEKLSEGN